MGLSKDARIPLWAAIIMGIAFILVDPKQETIRLILLAAMAVSAVFFVKDLDWVNQRTFNLSILREAKLSEQLSTVRFMFAIFVAVSCVAIFGVVTWTVEALPKSPTAFVQAVPSSGAITDALSNPKLTKPPASPVPIPIAPSRPTATPLPAGNTGVRVPSKRGVTTQVPSRSGTKTETTPAEASPPPKKSQYELMSNTDLQTNAILLAREMRDLEMKYRDREDNEMAREQNAMIRATTEAERNNLFSVFRELDSQIRSEFQNAFNQQFLVSARLIRDEILRRLPPQPKPKESIIALEYGSLAGPNPVTEAANYIESLARMLPVK
jgi:hypothetical protein